MVSAVPEDTGEGKLLVIGGLDLDKVDDLLANIDPTRVFISAQASNERVLDKLNKYL